MEMVTVAQAEDLVNAQMRDYGSEKVNYINACGRVLAENLVSDRDFPPFNRATVDGIGIAFNGTDTGIRNFKITGIQAAGAKPLAISTSGECIEIMTGAAIDASIDTIIRYEDIAIVNQVAILNDIEIKRSQNIHRQGVDHKKGDVVANANTIITPATIGLAASIGKRELLVKKLPHTIIITTGDELISIDEEPNAFQLRRSNGDTISSAIEQYGIYPDSLHLRDDYEVIKQELDRCLGQYEVVIMCGGVSMGKFDYIPKVLDALGSEALFQKVRQRPGKPFWFGIHGDLKLIFAFPGNPVSVFLCLHRYFVPWLHATLGLKSKSLEYAILEKDISIPYPLQYFAQVRLRNNSQGQLFAEIVNGNGSGDFSNLIHTDAFMELPMNRNEFHAGEAYRIWRYAH